MSKDARIGNYGVARTNAKMLKEEPREKKIAQVQEIIQRKNK